MNNRSLCLLVVLFIGALSLRAQTPPTVLGAGERRADLYYWDTNWVDYNVATHPEKDYTLVTLYNLTPFYSQGGAFFLTLGLVL